MHNLHRRENSTSPTGLVPATKLVCLRASGTCCASYQFSAIALLCSFGSTALAGEVNLLSNPDFSKSSEIAGWDNLTYSAENALTWANADADSRNDSGSAQVSNDQPYMTDGASAETGQCFAVKPGAHYRYGAKRRSCRATLLQRWFVRVFPNRHASRTSSIWIRMPRLTTASRGRRRRSRVVSSMHPPRTRGAC